MKVENIQVLSTLVLFNFIQFLVIYGCFKQTSNNNKKLTILYEHLTKEVEILRDAMLELNKKVG